MITNVGPVHIELVGSLEGVARAKAELLQHVPVAIIPADVPLLDPYLPEDLDVVVLRCLAKDPALRYPDAEILEAALGRCSCASSWDKAQARRWWLGGRLAPAVDNGEGRP